MSPLDGLLIPGSYGHVREHGPGVIISRKPASDIALIMPRRGQRAAVETLLRDRLGLTAPGPLGVTEAPDLKLIWTQPNQWMAIATQPGFTAAAREALAGMAAVFDIGHARILLGIKGPAVTNLLAKGVALDLHESVFPSGTARATTIAHHSVLIERRAPGAFTLYLLSTYAWSFWQWIEEHADQLGYRIEG